METVKLNKGDLLKIVRENKETHVNEFNESVEDYKAAVLVVAKNNLKAAKTGEVEKFKFESFPAKPVSHENEYNRAIRMLELSVDEEITLQEHEFQQLVLDEWTWKHQFATANATYKSYVN